MDATYQLGWRAAIGAGLVGGVVYALAVLSYATRLGYHPLDVPLWFGAWAYGGLVLQGAVPIALVLYYGLVSPAGLLLVGIALWLRAEAQPSPGEPLVVLAGVWWIYVLVFLLAAGIEYGIRTTLDALPSPARTLFGP